MRKDWGGALGSTIEGMFRIVLKGKQWRQGEQVRKSPGAEVRLVHPEKGKEAGVAERD